MSRWGLPSASQPVTCPSALFLHCRHYFGLSITWTLRQMVIYNWPKARCSQQKSGKSFKVFAKQQFRKLCEIKHKLPNDHVIGPKGLNRGPSWRMSDAVKRIAATSHFPARLIMLELETKLNLPTIRRVFHFKFLTRYRTAVIGSMRWALGICLGAWLHSLRNQIARRCSKKQRLMNVNPSESKSESVSKSSAERLLEEAPIHWCARWNYFHNHAHWTHQQQIALRCPS